MLTTPVNLQTVTHSVWAVPPLARAEDGTLDTERNRRLMQHIEQGGITTLLYGGNAIFYHLTMKEYRQALELISTNAANTSLVIPAVGPAFGTMMDQANILTDFNFPTVMLLPQSDVVSSAGIATGVRKFVEKFGKPVVLYLKFDLKVTASDARALVDDGLISAIKYAVVREDHTKDDYLRDLVGLIDPTMILSGLGDQPAIIHMRDFGLGGFTTGTGCVAPRLSSNLLKAIQQKDWTEAENIRETFVPLEDLRNSWGPIAVLHAAVRLAGIAQTGPIIPLLSEPSADRLKKIEAAAKDLLALNNK
jgi:dihydrodipicolinate synthase/N-acetylneuraminate lyase